MSILHKLPKPIYINKKLTKLFVHEFLILKYELKEHLRIYSLFDSYI